MKEKQDKDEKPETGKSLARHLSKEAQERRRKYLLDHRERLYYENRAANGEQYV